MKFIHNLLNSLFQESERTVTQFSTSHHLTHCKLPLLLISLPPSLPHSTSLVFSTNHNNSTCGLIVAADCRLTCMIKGGPSQATVTPAAQVHITPLTPAQNIQKNMKKTCKKHTNSCISIR